ncbi:MAG: MmcQ/YjbR family DNA-binding protein [Vicinamibacteria bacterium]
MPPVNPETRLRKICMAFPQVTERLSHSAPTWFFKGKKSFLMLMLTGHHQNQFPHFWCAAGAGVQADLITTDPETFFRPPYVGGRGWVGVRLDRKPDWALLERLCAEAYRVVAGKA